MNPAWGLFLSQGLLNSCLPVGLPDPLGSHPWRPASGPGVAFSEDPLEVAPGCSLEGLCRQACHAYLLNWETEARKCVKRPLCTPLTPTEGPVCLLPPPLAVVGTVLLRPSPGGLDCLSLCRFAHFAFVQKSRVEKIFLLADCKAC